MSVTERESRSLANREMFRCKETIKKENCAACASRSSLVTIDFSQQKIVSVGMVWKSRYPYSRFEAEQD